MSRMRGRWLRTLIAGAIAIPFVVPFLFLLSTTFRTTDDYAAAPGGLPRAFTTENLTEAWTEADLGRALINTLVVCVVACALCTLIALPAAYWFRLHTSRAANGLRWLLVAFYAIPVIAWLIPVFVLLAAGELVNNLVVTGIIAGVSSTPFALYLMYTFLRQMLTPELLDAAMLDGAGIFRILWSIATPLAKPAIATAITLTFVWTFGDLLIVATLLQGDPSVYTITLAATSLSTRESVNLQGQAAAAFVALLPTLVVFAVAQRSLARGFGGASEK